VTLSVNMSISKMQSTYHWLYIGLFLKNFASLTHTAVSLCSSPHRYTKQRFSHTFSHNLCTSLSANCLQVINVSIQPSKVGMVAGSVDGIDDRCVGSGIFTSSMLVSIVAVGKGVSATRADTACCGVVVRGVVVASNLADDVRVSREGCTSAGEVYRSRTKARRYVSQRRGISWAVVGGAR
jgi:hypothetical protein